LSRPELPLISLVVPVFNEEDSIDQFLKTVEQVTAGENCKWEFVFINDGSQDNTLAVLRAAKLRNPAVKILSLSRNFGKEAATTAGLDHATGDAVIPIDVDLQDPPELIGQFIARWRSGAEVVYGVRSSRESDGAIKRATARIFYRFFNAISQTKIPFNAGDYRLMDRRVVDEIGKMRERSRFMKGIMAWPGFRSESIEFVRQKRAAGGTSWNYWKLWNFALDGITSFSTLPLRVWVYLGAVIAMLAFLYVIFIIVDSIVVGSVPGYPSLMAAVMFFGGVQLLSIGLVGEYVGRIFHETKGRPIYIIETIE